jgi:sarcosine oxidase subunit alpha
MPDTHLTVNGIPVSVKEGTTVAAAILTISGEPRGPLCGMGICYECRVIIDGESHARSCQIVCRPGMQVTTS